LNPYSYPLKNQNLILLPQKAVFWEEQEMLIISDVHLGKVGHFRKAGIPIPRNLEQEDLALLSDLIRMYKPKTLLILGDFFHSTLNQDWYWIPLWRDQFPNMKVILVKGNHDILSQERFLEAGMEYIPDHYSLYPFYFCHEPILNESINLNGLYPLSGHVHPGITLNGKGNQSRRLSCFYFSPEQGLLPAFGRFTGTHKLAVTRKSHIFIVSGNSVLPLPTNPIDPLI